MVVDYRNGPEETIRQIRNCRANKVGVEPKHGLDAGIGPQCAKVLRDLIVPSGSINLVLPDDFDVSPAIKSLTAVGAAHNQDGFGDARDLAFVLCRYFTRGLQSEAFSGHPFEVRPSGLEGVEQALKDLKVGRASAIKYAVRISDTPGI